MKATITLTHRRVEHNDHSAAGFEKGWWWTVNIPRQDYFAESALGTRKQAEQHARELAVSQQASVIEVKVGQGLMSREDDERRVAALLDEAAAPTNTV